LDLDIPNPLQLPDLSPRDCTLFTISKVPPYHTYSTHEKSVYLNRPVNIQQQAESKKPQLSSV
jgi:hypothetical protein